MYFIVFAAFVIVLSLPDDGPPWTTLEGEGWAWAIAIGQVVLTVLVAGVFSRLVKVKLEREAAWLPAAQMRLGQANTAIKITLMAGLLTSIFFTQWGVLVRRWVDAAHIGSFPLKRLWGLDELLMLGPFVMGLLLAWLVLYPADRAVRQVALELRLLASAPARPVWRIAAYLSFMIRQHLLVMAIPMTLILVANDGVSAYGRRIRAWTKVDWADQAVLAVVAGVIFFFAPVILRYVWHTRVLPPGDLRRRLDELCRRVRLRYRQILIWESDGMVVNAAVMGLLRPVRYIMLSDGLLEMMDDEKIEAVFGHEAGHVKHHHITYYLLFAVVSMLIVGGITELILWAMIRWPEYFPERRLMYDYLQVGSMLLIVLVWAFGFGAVSRRFEWQADLFGARSVTPPASGCRQPCFVHGTELNGPRRETGGEVLSSADHERRLVCATSATLFAEALVRVASLNGIPAEARSWRHSSIGNRVRLLRRFAHDPAALAGFERTVWIIKGVMLAGTVVGGAIAAWLYWPF